MCTVEEDPDLKSFYSFLIKFSRYSFGRSQNNLATVFPMTGTFKYIVDYWTQDICGSRTLGKTSDSQDLHKSVNSSSAETAGALQLAFL